MINFEKKTWYNKNDTPNLDKRIPISATHLNRIEDAVSAVVKHENDMKSHWWKTSRIVDIIIERISKVSTSEFFDFFDYQTAVAVDIYYSDSVSVKVDSDTGEKYIELNEANTWNISYNNHGDASNSTLKNKYIILSVTETNYSGGTHRFYTSTTTTKNGGVLYYCNSSTSRADTYIYPSSNSSKHIYGLKFSDMYTTQTRNIYGEEEYVSSPDRDAHSDGWNETELLMYEYLGIPFENSRESGGMITGWYYGNNISNRFINTQHKPKRVVINDVNYATDYGNGHTWLADNGFYVGVTSSNTYNALATKYSYVVFY